jgi:hypothetical protein
MAVFDCDTVVARAEAAEPPFEIDVRPLVMYVSTWVRAPATAPAVAMLGFVASTCS